VSHIPPPDGFGPTFVSLAPGDVLCGRYRLDAVIGSGGMGTVWRARDAVLDERIVALKMLPAVLARDRRSVARLKAEAVRQMDLGHPHIVRLYHFEQDPARADLAFLVMQHVAPSEGEPRALTLDDRLADHPDGLPLEDVKTWAPRIAEAIDHAHRQGLLHRDVKPANILFDGDGRAYLADFGIACEIRSTMTRVTGQVDSSGTLPYMSPQQLRGVADPRNDVYSFAATLYEALSGRPPISPEGDPHFQIMHVEPPPIADVPERVNAMLRRGLAKDAEARPRSCGELLRAEGAAASAVRSPGTFRTFDLGGGMTMDFVWIPPGEFVQGSPASEKGRYSDEGPQRRVRFASGFWLARTEVTQAQWERVMGATVREQRDRANPDWLLRGEGESHPMYYVNWHESVEFCERLSSLLSSQLSGGESFRLPSESEWEYACRAGRTTRYHFGDEASDLDEYAWYAGNSRSSTHPVGRKRANAWGLHDMHGNVWEWCADVWHADYEGAPRDGSAWTSGGDSARRVLRGGSWLNYPDILRAAYRVRRSPDYRELNVGFRPALDSN